MSDEKPPNAAVNNSRTLLQKAVFVNEFVPRVHNHYQQQYNANNSIPPSDERPATMERQLSDDEWMSGMSSEEKVQLMLHDHIMTLTENPGMFHIVIKELAPLLTTHVRTEALMKDALFVIFDHVSNLHVIIHFLNEIKC